MFTFSDPAEAVYAGWYTAACGYDGFLRWAYNSWVGEPLTDSRFRTFPAGDTYIIYPGARSSVRFERLVEGIQDAEKISILKKEFAAAGTPEAASRLEQLETLLSGFATITPEAKPNSAFCTRGPISFFIRNTQAAPRDVPSRGIRLPHRMVRFICCSCTIGLIHSV